MRQLIPPACPPGQRLEARTLCTVGHVIGIAGTGSNAGKTTFAETLIARLANRGLRVGALKVTRAHSGECPVGDAHCLVCASAGTTFRIVDHAATISRTGKDTGRYVAAGAAHVLWLITSPEAVRDGLAAILSRFSTLDVLIAEGNSFCDYVNCDDLVLVVGPGEPKPSTAPLLPRVTRVIAADESRATLTARGLAVAEPVRIAAPAVCIDELAATIAR